MTQIEQIEQSNARENNSTRTRTEFGNLKNGNKPHRCKSTRDYFGCGICGNFETKSLRNFALKKQRRESKVE
jgi:hypothetical protein